MNISSMSTHPIGGTIVWPSTLLQDRLSEFKDQGKTVIGFRSWRRAVVGEKAKTECQTHAWKQTILFVISAPLTGESYYSTSWYVYSVLKKYPSTGIPCKLWHPHPSNMCTRWKGANKNSTWWKGANKNVNVRVVCFKNNVFKPYQKPYQKYIFLNRVPVLRYRGYGYSGSFFKTLYMYQLVL